ncbi:T9SS type A sorting domain-containing protein [candidate division TA06 bacterium]|uniref:T9SS type A sorting domain-containing protein n=1 Tax=candidate division TA06 bacterium TaxID=2250710 RepID=A0A523UQD5_UNCT6|nr:MAG: T9SS type A sorting domain-containing protein [candidate division TA06 bacterium]
MFPRIILTCMLLLCLGGVGHGGTSAPYSTDSELRVTIRNSAPTNMYGVVATVGEAPDWVMFEAKVDTVADSLLPGEARDAVFNFSTEVGESGAFEIEVEVSTGEGIWIERFHVPASSSELPEAPRSTALLEPEPNPFFASTSIRFNLAKDGEVDLTVYDISGRVVNRLVSGVQSVGLYALSWDGQDSDGNKVASGSYFLKLSVGDYSETRKLVLAR